MSTHGLSKIDLALRPGRLPTGYHSVVKIFSKKLGRRPLPDDGFADARWAVLVAETPLLAALDRSAQARLRELALLFLHEKQLIGAGGLQLDDAMRIRIAALACLPILELGLDACRDFVTVIVYPAEFVVRDREYIDDDGVAHTGDEILSGEAWDRGPVVLAWRDVQASGRGNRYNVVAHEIAHKLDLLDGVVNGIPPLHAGMPVAEWTTAFQTAYDDLVTRLERGEDTWLDPYAAEDPGEFFAVCSEMFFDVPAELTMKYPALYAQLASFYRQDPARAGIGL